MNAMRAVGGKKDGKVQVIAAIEGDQFILSVVDNGVGLAKADKNKIFRMGFTTKKSAIANTVGKGLAYSQLFLRQAWKGSKIEAFDNKEDLNLRQAGATFRITIPRIVDIKETKDEAMNAGLQESIKTKISDGDVRSLDRLADRGSLLSAKDVFRSLGSSELKTAFARSIVAIREPDLPNNKIQDLVNTSGEGWIVFVDPAGQVIGRMYRSVSEDGSLYLGDLGVLSDYQGMKQNMSQTEKPRIGSFLLNYFLKQASSANRSVYIPAEGNSLGFYKKFLDTRGIHFSTERERYDDWTNIRISSENLRLPKFDSAMGSDFDKGGIDLNPANQKLVVQGKGNDFAFSDQLKDLDPDKIAGFFPIIVAIKNVQNLSKILGINEM